MAIVRCFLVVILSTVVAFGQSGSWSAFTGDRYEVHPNVVYRQVNGWQGKLDMYLPIDRDSQTPTLIWIHGGGWTRSSKEQEFLYALPYLEAGWSVINVEYRLAADSPAPAAVEDCRCALNWIVANAAKYKLGTDRLVLSGISAGGHLAMTTAMLSRPPGRDQRCYRQPPPKIAAVVNWFGPADITDLITGPNSFDQAVTWFRQTLSRSAVAKGISPINFVSSTTPPIYTVHGAGDDVIPVNQSRRLHASLDRASVTNRLYVIEGRGHGDFTREEWIQAHKGVRTFLSAHLKIQ